MTNKEDVKSATAYDLAEAIRNMESDGIKQRSKIGVLRSIYTEIEHAQSIGYALEDILKALKEKQFEMELQQFKNALYVIRKERGVSGKRRAKPNAGKEKTSEAGNQQQGSFAAKEVGNETGKVVAGKVAAPPTLAEMKRASENFDIDPTQFD